jgi:hypothetical protein
MVTAEGFAFAAATRSATVLNGEAVLTTSTTGCPATSATGTKSFAASKGIFEYSEGLMARLAVCPMPSV